MKLQKETWLPKEVQAKLRELRAKKPPKVRPVFLVAAMIAGIIAVFWPMVLWVPYESVSLSVILSMYAGAMLMISCLALSD